jgi:glycosyltransferase involved in cell wall biosynthesis
MGRLVSVILPAYRAERCLAESLRSVREQTCPDWELIVVEDGSQDSTEQQVRRFAGEAGQDRVTFVRHGTNQGPGSTRNTGIRLACGEFIALLDADDRWLPDHLAACVGALGEQNADVAYSTVVKFDDPSGRLLGIWGPGTKDLERFPESLTWRNFITPSSAVLRRCVVDQVGAFDTDPKVQGCEDLDYWLRCAAAGLRFTHVPGCHVMYRKGGAGAGTGNWARIAEHHAKVLQKHSTAGVVPAGVLRRAYVYYRTAAGVLYLERDAAHAAEQFRAAWKASPARLDLLAAAGLCRSLFRVVPGGPLVRWIRRRKGYG